MERVRAGLRISCADAVELVTEHLEGALSPADRERFAAHLTRCEACAVYVDQVRATIRIVAATGQLETAIDPELMADLVVRFRAASRTDGGALDYGC